MEQYKKDMIAKYWNNGLERQLEEALSDNPALAEVFKKHPERKEEYKFKILDAQPVGEAEMSPDNIQCKSCFFRLPAITVDGRPVERHSVPYCKLYEPPETKPHEVLWDAAPCDYYEKET